MLEIRNKIKKLVKEYYQEEFRETEFDPKNDKVNYAGRVFDEKEIQNLVDSALDFWLTEGRFSQEFENKLSNFYDNSEIILTNSGSSSNLLAISALTSPKLGKKQLMPGDEIITVAAGFPSTLSPILQNNFVPVFVDVDLETYNISIENIEDAVSNKTKAIFILTSPNPSL
jgi:CDP-6-deoxy-D-xylo-4-hexulose-3-dehydrase